MNKINKFLSALWKVLLGIGSIILFFNLSKAKRQVKKERKKDVDLIDTETKLKQREALDAKKNKNISDLADDTDSMLFPDDDNRDS